MTSLAWRILSIICGGIVGANLFVMHGDKLQVFAVFGAMFAYLAGLCAGASIIREQKEKSK